MHRLSSVKARHIIPTPSYVSHRIWAIAYPSVKISNIAMPKDHTSEADEKAVPRNTSGAAHLKSTRSAPSFLRYLPAGGRSRAPLMLGIPHVSILYIYIYILRSIYKVKERKGKETSMMGVAGVSARCCPMPTSGIPARAASVQLIRECWTSQCPNKSHLNITQQTECFFYTKKIS